MKVQTRLIRQLRKRKGWTQQKLAQRIKSYQTNISQVETGTWKPGPNYIERLAKALGCTAEELRF